MKRMCHLIILLVCGLSAAHLCLSVSLVVNCETAAVSKPSVPSLVESIVRQQDLGCPFLVISGGNECYHNPLSCSFLPLSAIYKTLLQPGAQVLTTVFCPPLALLLLVFVPVYSCFLFWLASSAPVALCSPLSSLWSALWSYCGLAVCVGDWTVRDDVQGKPQLIKNTLDCEALVLH